ncbi:4'-phosphopantetheinyl transferase superfamily protein [Salinactinospora qingdaonensis]|uniref:4'-phosphopantetheinyl transferase superfamily protein n=1 Tax=Salinactinospora qingdaonensis TaxID=702744 RepID=A0ABP7F3G8_9ACTN
MAADRDRYAVAHALARLLCAREAGCSPQQVTFELYCGRCAALDEPRGEPHGKPRPVGVAAGLEISITHSGQRVGVALTQGAPVGLDVEHVRDDRDIEGIAEHALTRVEREALATHSPAERTRAFFTYWSRKEALLKATGQGLSGGLNSVTVSGSTEQPAVLAWDSPTAPPHVWLTDLAAGSDYRAAVAAITPHEVNVTEHDAAPLLRDVETSAPRG